MFYEEVTRIVRNKTMHVISFPTIVAATGCKQKPPAWTLWVMSEVINIDTSSSLYCVRVLPPSVLRSSNSVFGVPYLQRQNTTQFLLFSTSRVASNTCGLVQPFIRVSKDFLSTDRWQLMISNHPLGPLLTAIRGHPPVYLNRYSY